MAAQSVDPMAFREWMAPHVAAIRLFTSAVDDVLNEKQHPGTESVAMAEIATEQNYKSRSAWEFPFTDTHSFAGATLRAASDYARSFAELFAADRPPIYAQFPVARAALEAAGVSAWLSELGIAPLDRLKRGLCELLYSANEVSSLELSDDSNQAVELWIGVADSFGWNVNNGRTKPVIDGTSAAAHIGIDLPACRSLDQRAERRSLVQPAVGGRPRELVRAHVGDGHQGRTADVDVDARDSANRHDAQTCLHHRVLCGQVASDRGRDPLQVHGLDPGELGQRLDIGGAIGSAAARQRIAGRLIEGT